MRANKHQSGRAFTPVGATSGAQRIARDARALGLRRCDGAGVQLRNSGTAVATDAATTTPLLHNVAGVGRILRLRLIDPAF